MSYDDVLIHIYVLVFASLMIFAGGCLRWSRRPPRVRARRHIVTGPVQLTPARSAGHRRLQF